MKKLLLVTLMVCVIGTFAACRSENPIMETENSYATETTEESVVENDVEEIPEDTSNEGEEVVELPQVLSMAQTYTTRYEWQDDIWVMYSEYSNITMWEGAEQYPEMDGTLSEIAGMQTRTMDDEADNIISFVQEIMDANSTDFETQVSTLDVQVRRADSVVVSFLSDSYSDYGFIEDFRGMWGSNYDAQTGEQLLLSDVVLDMEAIPGIVLEELNSHLWAGDFYQEAVVKDYFANTPEDGISWTLDYNGVTFYFGDGELTESGNGRQTATVSFAEHPELFEEKYMNVPEAYMARLPLDSSFFTDLDGDGTLEELNVTGVYNEEGRFYSQFGIYTDTDGHYHYEDFYAYGYNPYYVKTADGKHYLYLFCEENDADNRQMMLVVFDVSDGQFVRAGEINVAPAYIPSDNFILPLNPDNLLLDNFDSLEQDFGIYMVGENGMPIRK